VFGQAEAERDGAGQVVGYVGTITDITERKRAEEELQRFFNLIPDLTCIASTDGYFLKINPRWEETLGFTEQEIISTPFLDLIHPDDRDATIQEVARQIGGSATIRFNNRYRCKDGGYKWLEWMATPSPDKKLLFAAARDITGRKKGEEKLHESERKYRQLMEQATEGIFVVDQKSRYLDVNPAGLQMVGYSLEELRGLTITGLMPPDEFQKAPSRFSEILAGKTVVSERTLRRKDGSLFLAEITAKLMSDGNILATKRDITERTKFQEKLQESNEVLERVFATTHFHVLLLDTKYNFIRVNKAYANSSGYESDFFIGKNHFDLYPSEELKSKFLRVVQTGEPYTVYSRPFEWPDQPQLGITYWDLAVYPVRGISGEVESLLFTLLEVTERVRGEKALIAAKEEAERANKAKEVFLSSMSHEIRTPLTAIMGFSQLLASDTEHPLTDSQKTLLGKVTDSGGQLLELVNNVFDLVRIESGDITLSIEAVDMKSMAEIAMTGSIQVAADRGVKLGSKPSLADCQVMADRIRLNQALNHLLLNAIQFNKKGGETTLSWNLLDENKVRISISDEGAGISSENMKNLYKPFDRLGFEGLNIKGFGIGLTLVKRLVELMGGQVGVESAVGKGSTFYIDLPGGKL
jgi:PAS domain S-box-containing protein